MLLDPDHPLFDGRADGVDVQFEAIEQRGESAVETSWAEVSA